MTAERTRVLVVDDDDDVRRMGFAGTRQMTVRSATQTSLDPAAGRATVAVELAESSSTPAFNRAWSGTWFLVRVGNAWLLDAPSFRA